MSPLGTSMQVFSRTSASPSSPNPPRSTICSKRTWRSRNWRRSCGLMGTCHACCHRQRDFGSPSTNRLKALPSVERGFSDLRPERPNLACFGVRLFRALLREAVSVSGIQLPANSAPHSRAAICDRLQRKATDRDRPRQFSGSETLSDNARQIATKGNGWRAQRQPKTR